MEEGSGHADVWLMTINIAPQVFNLECLKGGMVHQVERGVCLNHHKEGAGEVGVI